MTRPDPGQIATTSLRASAASVVGVDVKCGATRTSCKGVLSMRSALRIRVGGRLKYLTIVRDTRYTVAAGKRKKLKLKLGREARALLARRRSMKVKITLKPSGGKAVTRTVTLRR